MGDGVDIDLYANLDEEFTQPEAEFTSHGDDLYDDVITAPSSSDPAEIHNKGDSSTSSTTLPTSSGFTGKKYMLYVGNLTWWTTDEDLSDAIVSIGVSDLLEVKFYENRANGQSKGFALVSVGSEASSRLIFEKLARKEFYGQAPQITPYSKQALSNFEAQARKGAGGAAATEDRRNSADSTPSTMFYDKNARMPRPGVPPARPQFNPRMARPPTMVPGPPHPGPPMPGPPATFVNGTRPPFTPTGPPPGMPPHHGPPPRGPGPPPRMVSIFRPPNMMGMPPNRGPPQGPPRGPPPFGQRGPPPRPEWERPPGAPFHHRGPPPTAVPPPGVRPHVQMGGMPGMPPGLPPPVSQAPHMGVPPPAPHVNPAFFPPPHSAAPPQGAIPPPIPNAADPYGRPPPTVYPDPYGRPPPSDRDRERERERSREREREREPPAPALTEQEFEEIFQRNKTVSSSAINRAVSDASAGEFASAIETLVTAISLIKQSKIASDDRCKILISSLQDTLHGIEEKSYGSKSQPRRSRSRDRERDRDRKERGRSHRSRSRDREYRERSRDRERERYHEERHRDRDRDRDREREREREYRRH